MADDWEVVVPSRAVSPAPLSLPGPDASQPADAMQADAPAIQEDSDLHVFAAPWATPTKPGEVAAAPEQLGPEAEASRLGGSAVFVSSPPPPQEDDGSPSVATPMQAVKPIAADSDMDLEADVVFSEVGASMHMTIILSQDDCPSDALYATFRQCAAIPSVRVAVPVEGRFACADVQLDEQRRQHGQRDLLQWRHELWRNDPGPARCDSVADVSQPLAC